MSMHSRPCDFLEQSLEKSYLCLITHALLVRMDSAGRQAVKLSLRTEDHRHLDTSRGQ